LTQDKPTPQQYGVALSVSPVSAYTATPQQGSSDGPVSPVLCQNTGRSISHQAIVLLTGTLSSYIFKCLLKLDGNWESRNQSIVLARAFNPSKDPGFMPSLKLESTNSGAILSFFKSNSLSSEHLGYSNQGELV
jgi:hypothetical protein